MVDCVKSTNLEEGCGIKGISSTILLRSFFRNEWIPTLYEEIIVWAAIDWFEGMLNHGASEGRGRFEAYVFLREILKHCENKPEVVVDRGFWYRGSEKIGIKIQTRNLWWML